MKRFSTKDLTAAAVVAALYAALSLLSDMLGLAFGPIQCRLSEALCVLPLVLPSSVWGLTLGCLLTNILSPYGLLDLAVGTFATFLAACLTRRCRSQWTAVLPPVLCNGVLVGGLIAFQTAPAATFLAAFLYNGLTVALGEVLSCGVLGLMLLRLLRGRLSHLLPGHGA
ncbi:MAG: QueT transporter family protein [Oscillospiraceae bacterium]